MTTTKKTQTLRNRTFTTSKGNLVTVWNERELVNFGPWASGVKIINTWCELDGHRLELFLDPGCAFQAETAAAKAGW
jgi:hypothetical protein